MYICGRNLSGYGLQVEKHLQRREMINRKKMNFILGKYNLPNYYVTKL